MVVVRGRWVRAVGFAAVLAVCGTVGAGSRSAVAAAFALPASLPDADFWALVGEISEPGGYFRIADNFTSNEREVGQLFTMLRQRGVQGGVYIGVGPEQNFTYMASIRPTMAFIVDIRRQAVIQHLMFKAVFELAKDRADFISLLFSKPRPDGLDASTPIQRIWQAYGDVGTDPVLVAKNSARIVDHLTKTHKFVFTADESSQLDWVLQAFSNYGPAISTRGGSPGFQRFIGTDGTFAGLTGWAVDGLGQPQSFLSTEENYRTVKTLEEKNLVVPVSGDFGGPKAIRAIGDYLRKRGGTVTAFYVSNVEQYLFQDGKERAFYDNVATLPMSDTSVFIRPYSLRRSDGTSLCGISNFLKAAREGHINSNNDALVCAR
jgi:hypothetical protein